MSEHSGAEAVVNVDYCRSGCTGIEHGQEGGESIETGSIPDARRNGDEWFRCHSPHNAREDPVHSRYHEEDPGPLKLLPFVK